MSLDIKEKKCKGIGKAKDFIGCGGMAKQRKYGLCMSCYPQFLYQTDEGKAIVKKHAETFSGSTLKRKIKEANQLKRELDPILNPKKYFQYLQDEINKLSRMIDMRFGIDTCIDCNKPFSQARDRDAGHFKSRGSNPSLRYNLHNIHSQKSSCNSNGLGGGKSLGYYRGLEMRYGSAYAEFVDKQLQITYHYIGLKENEIREKLKIVRKLIRDFESFDFKDSIQARQQMNILIGIYTEKLPPL